MVDTSTRGFLKEAKFRRPTTLPRYRAAWTVFLAFAVFAGRLLSDTDQFQCMTHLDRSLDEFCEHQFTEEKPKYIVSNALQYVNIAYPHWPTSVRANYPMIKASLRGWKHLEPGESKDPCPYEVMCLIAHRTWLSMVGFS